uniref:RRM domain-containing protein n=1 Tax=Rhodosorus marinus TaxID=101924 RepID=A0A7S2ZV46_9RHOD
MNIDRPLEDIIKESRKERGGKPRKSRPRKGGKGGGDAMQVDTRIKTGGIQKDTKNRKKKSSGVSVGAFKAAAAEAGLTGLSGTRGDVSNLGPGVTDGDLSELFSGVGPLVKVKLIFDKNHRSSGNAIILFRNRSDAVEAIKKYHEVPLDGKPLILSLSTKGVGPESKGSTSGATGAVKIVSSHGKRIITQSSRGSTPRRRGGSRKPGRSNAMNM